MKHVRVIEVLNEIELMQDIYEKSYGGKQRVSGKAQMQFRRRFLDKWVSHGWMEKEHRGLYQISSMGNQLLTIYGDLI